MEGYWLREVRQDGLLYLVDFFREPVRLSLEDRDAGNHERLCVMVARLVHVEQVH